MDFRTERLFLNRYRVKQLCVVSKAAESFWSFAFHKRRGMSSLVWIDATTVKLWGVVVGGRKKRQAVEVALTRADSELALRVAHAVVNLAERHNFRVLDAVVEQKDENSVVVGGEHDLLGERQCKLNWALLVRGETAPAQDTWAEGRHRAAPSADRGMAREAWPLLACGQGCRRPP
jgi:hypothetical protein